MPGIIFWRARIEENQESGALFGSVRGVGYKRLAHDDAHEIGGTARAAIRRKARRTTRMITRAVDAANEISPSAKRRALGEIASLHMIAHISGERVTKNAARDDKPPPLAELFNGVLRHLGAKGNP